MKWLQHDTNARNDVKIKKLKKKFGAGGYGVYFQLLEIIGENVEANNFDEWGYVDKTHDKETLADECGVSLELLEEILKECNRLGLLEKKDGKLFCEKLRLDSYAERIKRTQEYKKQKGSKKAEQTPNKVEKSTSTIDNNTVEDNTVQNKTEDEKQCLSSLFPCDEYCTWQIGKELDTHKYNVDNTLIELKDYIKQNPKKYTVFHESLVRWVRDNLKKEYYTHMDEMEKLHMEHEHPDKVKERIASAKILVQKGIL